jgi:hypothetical protein
MEQTGKPVDATRGLYDLMDIDRTLDSFVEYFYREFMANIPQNVLVDKRLLAKHIREFYRSRGSQDSYRFLFRILFNEEIDFYYPSEDILRTSDGRWIQETVIRGIQISGDSNNLDGKQIKGLTSGATARVQEVLQIIASGLNLYQITLENVIGSFIENEIIDDGFGTQLSIFNNVGSIQNVRITRGGAFHQKGDTIRLTGESGGFALGVITNVTDTSAITFRVQNGGSGYRISNTTIQIAGGNPQNPAQFEINALSPTEIVQLSDTINPVKDVPLNSVPFNAGSPKFSGSNINTTLANALSFTDTLVGSIDTITLLNPGSGYTGSLPTITLIDEEISNLNIVDPVRGGFKGRNAVIVASRAYGSIATVAISSSDINFLQNDIISITNLSKNQETVLDLSIDSAGSSPVTRTLIRQNTYEARVTAEIRGTFQLPGRFTDTKGFISWNNKLQDNDFYQEYSYVIRARKMLSEYKNIVLSLLHPVGTKIFGMMNTESTADLSSITAGSSIITYKRSPNDFQLVGPTSKSLVNDEFPFWYANNTLKATVSSVPGSNLMLVFENSEELNYIVEGFAVIKQEENEDSILLEDGDSIIFEPAEDRDEILVTEESFNIYDGGPYNSSGNPPIFDAESYLPQSNFAVLDGGSPFSLYDSPLTVDLVIQNVNEAETPVLFANGLYTINTISSANVVNLRTFVRPEETKQGILGEDGSKLFHSDGDRIMLENNNIEGANGVFYYFRGYSGTI